MDQLMQSRDPNKAKFKELPAVFFLFTGNLFSLSNA